MSTNSGEPTTTTVAAKIAQGDASVDQCMREYRILKAINHPHIVRAFGWFDRSCVTFVVAGQPVIIID